MPGGQRYDRDEAERIANSHNTTLMQLQYDEPLLKLSGPTISRQHLRWALGY